jgi:hypothetical protein
MIIVDWAYSMIGGNEPANNEVLILPRGWQT